MKSNPAESKFHALPGKKMLLALSVACISAAGSASAQVLVVSPTVSTAITSSNHADSALSYARQGLQYAEQKLQYLQQKLQYVEQVKQYEQLLMTVKGLGTNISITPNTLTQITDPSELVNQNCPGTSGTSVIGSALSSLSSAVSLNQPITQAQQKICANIVTLQIDEYNKTVIILNQMDQYGGTLQQLNKLANEVNSLGTTSGATTQAETLSATMAHSIQDWQTSVAGDDALIKSLQQQQQMLSKIALNGSNDILGNTVQAATFAKALQ